MKTLATQSDRPCPSAAGHYFPKINWGKCEGKGECVRVCPEGVFTLRRINQENYNALNFLQKLKQRVHGMTVAYADKSEDCLACGLCVKVCPEHAITLAKREINAG